MASIRVKQIRKRDGRIVDFNREKITDAIFKAVVAVGGHDRKKAEELTDKVIGILESALPKNEIPNVEGVQDVVEKILIEEGHAATAKAYILYRQKRKEVREAKELIGVKDDVKLSVNAIKVLKERYLLRDEDGNIVETPGNMFRRVADFIAKADSQYYKKSRKDVKDIANGFYEMMVNLEFLPNSPCLMNAGVKLGMLAACHVLPIGDSLDGIFKTLRDAILLHQGGSGTGFSFSHLRPRGSIIKSSGGPASGPVSFIKVYNSATEAVKSGGKRRGANMGILRVDHPDIVEFIISKEKDETLANFNLSVALTDKFMDAVEKDEYYDLIGPSTGQPVNQLSARKVFHLIVTMAWKSGDPGVIFIDKINKSNSNPTPELGQIEATNPCAESPLLPYESCVLGSINLAKMLKERGDKKIVDWEKLKNIVWNGVHFLDNMIDMNKYTLPEIEYKTRFGNRKIGLGVMGFADMLIQMGIPYNTEEAVKTGEKVMKFIQNESREASVALGKERGSFNNFKKSIWSKKFKHMRNATVNAIAPTGTISIIAGCSSGIEPLYAVSFVRHVLDNTELIEVNQYFEKIAMEKGFYSDTLMRMVARMGSIQHIEQIPEDARKVFITSMDVSPEYHVKVQAGFQRYTDLAVSKTVNVPNDANLEDVEKIYLLAYKSGCKGITIYRDRSKGEQVLNVEFVKKKKIIVDEDTGECEVC